MKDIEISHYDNKKLWEELNLSESNKERIKVLIEMIPKDVNSVADIGCGNGMFLNELKKNLKIKELVGIDFSEKAMEGVTTEKIVGDITEIPISDNKYDLVSALEVLEHLNTGEYLRAKEELARVSKKYILVSVPFNEDLELEFFKCPNCKTRYNTAHHKRTFSSRDIEELFIQEGFNCIEVRYISKRNRYFGLTTILNWFRKFKGVRKPSGTVCPVCGFKIDIVNSVSKTSKKKITKVGHLLKRVWPKNYSYKWIAGLYIKANQTDD